MMGSRLIFLHRVGWFPQEGRRKVAEPGIGYRFKPVGRLARRPSATNGESIPRGDEEAALAAVNSVILRFREKLRWSQPLA